MALERWRPFRELEEEMERFLEEWPGRWWRPWRPPRLRARMRAWEPAVDLFDQEDKLIAEFELPGVDRDTIDVSVVGGVLQVRAERKAPANIKDEDYYCCERPRGSFYRTIIIGYLWPPARMAGTAGVSWPAPSQSYRWARARR